jgi:ATP-dependent helicase/DNAse subunit B
MINSGQKQDKYSAVWLSHSSVSDFLKCERLYYLRNVWKNSNGRKINIVSPQMSLGSAVHAVIEPLAELKVDERKTLIEAKPLTLGEGFGVGVTKGGLLEKFESTWKKYSGLMGGFESAEEEKEYKERGIKMIQNVIENPGPIINKTVKFYNGDFIPNIYLSEDDNIILCGLVDWVEYLEVTDTLRVIDFKTGLRDEKEDSMQLPIYKILVESLQKRKVNDGAYWYLDRDKFYKIKEILDEDVELVKEKLLDIGKQIKEKKSAKTPLEMENNFKCKYSEGGGGCKYCREVEMIYQFDKGLLSIDNVPLVKYLGVGEYKQDLYFVRKD